MESKKSEKLIIPKGILSQPSGSTGNLVVQKNGVIRLKSEK